VTDNFEWTAESELKGKVNGDEKKANGGICAEEGMRGMNLPNEFLSTRLWFP
jgi:hypothetical protein